MNDVKLDRLFDLSRGETAPVAPDEFGARVLAVARLQERCAAPTFAELLESLFPKVAVATVLIMGACVLADVGFSTMTGSSLAADVNEISEQWLFAAGN